MGLLRPAMLPDSEVLILRTIFAEKNSFSQRGINMVDLMMWLVIAALLLASAIQGIGFYQHRVFIEQMSNDAANAGELAIARVSSDTSNGKMNDDVIMNAVKDTNTSGAVMLMPRTLGNGYYAIEASHPEVDDYQVMYSFDSRNNMKPGVNLIKAKTIDMSQSQSLAASCEAENKWSVQYFPKNAQDAPSSDVDPIASECRITTDSFVDNWGNGAPPIPGMPINYFTVHYSKSIELEAGVYEFRSTYDDRAWVYLDGKVVIDGSYQSPGGGGWPVQTVRLQVEGGKHNVMIKHVELGATAFVDFKITKIS